MNSLQKQRLAKDQVPANEADESDSTDRCVFLSETYSSNSGKNLGWHGRVYFSSEVLDLREKKRERKRFPSCV